MDKESMPDDDDIKTVLEAHGLLPEGDLLDNALGVVRLYSDRIDQLLSQVPAGQKRKALLAILEEGLMQEGLIPNNHERMFKM